MTEPIEPAASDAPVPSAAGDVPPSTGRRSLDRAPGERYGRTPDADDSVLTPRTGDGDDTSTPGGRRAAGPGMLESPGSPTRAVGMGVVGAIVGLVVFLILAVGFSFTAGLVVVAIFTGRFVGLFVRAGAGGSVSSAGRTVIALLIFLAGLTLALGITWMVAGIQGGVLPFGPFLDETYGTPLIALEYMLGTLMTWWSAR